MIFTVDTVSIMKAWTYPPTNIPFTMFSDHWSSDWTATNFIHVDGHRESETAVSSNLRDFLFHHKTQRRFRFSLPRSVPWFFPFTITAEGLVISSQESRFLICFKDSLFKCTSSSQWRVLFCQAGRVWLVCH